VYTRVQTPRFWGLPPMAGALLFQVTFRLLFLTSCWIVGTGSPKYSTQKEIFNKAF
jgi:hypothetical protein